MRGKAAEILFLVMVSGITPAYAGKSGEYGEQTARPQDHPRVCGEKLFCLIRHSLLGGSPPRMRGKVAVQSANSHQFRITPAYAGKRFRLPILHKRFRDHPRVCGEKVFFVGFV